MRSIINGLLLICSGQLSAAGAVIGEPGSCMIEIGIYTAHFTAYQSDSRGNEEFCEDLPDIGRTLFVMDYLHGSMKQVAVDFRIIRDLEDWGIFARWDNVAAIEDIEARTVFYQAGQINADERMTAEHDFLDPGGYIGVVSAPHPDKDIHYHAVFPFQVGRVEWLPWLMAMGALAGMGWYWRRQRSHA